MTSDLPARAAETTPERPWPVRVLSQKVAEYMARMPAAWVEGEVAQLTRRQGAYAWYLTLRDTDAEVSFNVSLPARVGQALPTPLQQGSRVVVHAGPSFWPKNGSFSLRADDIRPVGVGELMARLERLKEMLRQEGLFDPARKRPLPFLPRGIGLICGRSSAAEKDVVENARRRWPAAPFTIREVAVQGPDAVPQVTAALAELDADRSIDVIVIARGGGSFEDLLPFSNETLLRAVAAAVTPVVSAIGHDVDTPLIEFVADVRASTPTDAAKLIVPDMGAELAGIDQARSRMVAALARRLDLERRRLVDLRSRPVIANPGTVLARHVEIIDSLRERASRAQATRLGRAHDQVQHLRRQARAMSPQSTLDRGYAMVTDADGHVVRSRESVDVGELLRVRVADGDFAAQVLGEGHPETPHAAHPDARPRHQEDA